MIARYKCTKCLREFSENPGPVTCPYNCIDLFKYDNHELKVSGYKTIEWLNYEQLKKEGKID